MSILRADGPRDRSGAWLDVFHTEYGRCAAKGYSLLTCINMARIKADAIQHETEQTGPS
jgi:hypothetical protein